MKKLNSLYLIKALLLNMLITILSQLIQEQRQQQAPSGQISNRSGFKRKYLFSNIQNDQKILKRNQLINTNLLKKK